MEAKSRYQFVVSNNDFLGKNMLYPITWNLGKFVKTASEIGYEGLQWHPYRSTTVAGFQTRRGIMTEESKDAIVDLH